MFSRSIRNSIVTAAALVVVAAPALADSVNCVITAPEIRLRKGPSKHAKILAILKKDTPAVASGKCGGGWVKVTAKDGKLSGYVGGWALADIAPKTAAAAPATVELAKAEAPAPVAQPKDTPTNEALAVQITELRLKVLGMDRDLDLVKKDIQRIKGSMAHKARHKQAKRI